VVLGVSEFDEMFEHPPTLEGDGVRMEPIAERHREGLHAALADERVWRWVKVNAAADRKTYDGWFDESLANVAALREFPFVTVSRDTGLPVGTSRYLSLRPADRGLEIGYSLVSPAAWGSGANSEAKLLMMEYAFERLGCARVEFKTDALNERARAALAALPSSFEGIFRKHMLMWGGRWRDSAWYAITDDDWPEAKTALRARLEAQHATSG
jgi:RimJ/RimL family protein N-acetyltransferase